MLRLGLGQVQPRQLDPMVRLGLDAATVALATSDPGIYDTRRYIERIVAAPPMFPSTGAPSAPSVGKVSDLNPYLAVIANVREHPLAVLIGLLAVPLIFFSLGRASARR